MSINDIRQRSWDFGLTVFTVVLLGGLGVQSFVGTLYVWWAQRSIPNWEQLHYTSYIGVMNAAAAPQIILLVLVMGLCVPKRLFSRTVLLAVSTGMVLVGVTVGAITRSLGTAVTVYLSLAALIQVAVVVMTAAGMRGPSYMTEGRLTKLGSGLLHLGFIVFGIVVASLQHSPLMLPLFWTSTIIIVGGSVLSFYANRLSVRRTEPAEHPIDF